MGHNVEGSAFETIIDAIKDIYDADTYAPDIEDAHFKVGRLEGMGQVQSPAVRWRRPSGSFEPTEHAGPHAFTSSGNTLYFSSKYQELANVTAEITAANWLQLGCIQTGLLAATRVVMGKDGTPGGYVHDTEGDDEPEPSAQKGVQVLTMEWQWKILVPQAIGTLAEITSIISEHRLINTNPDPGTLGVTTTQPLL